MQRRRECGENAAIRVRSAQLSRDSAACWGFDVTGKWESATGVDDSAGIRAQTKWQLREWGTEGQRRNGYDSVRVSASVFTDGHTMSPPVPASRARRSATGAEGQVARRSEPKVILDAGWPGQT